MRLIDNIDRKKTLLRFGFGTDAMKSITVCTNCKSMENTKNVFCSGCGRKLPTENLYDYYRAQHESCCKCNAVLSRSMYYCPKCGTEIRKRK